MARQGKKRRKAEGLRNAQRQRKRISASKARRMAEQRKKRNVAWIIMAAIGAVIALLTYMFLSKETIELDAKTLCPTNGQLQTHSIYLLDGTDSIHSNVLDSLSSELSELKQLMQRGDKLTILKLGGNGAALELTELFSFCNPGRGDQFDILNYSQRTQDAKWKRDFDGPLQSSISAFSELEEGNRSPILEAIQAIGRRRDFNRNIARGELILVSDMLHFTDKFSQYRPGYNFKTANEKDDFGITATLNNIEVRIIYLRRNNREGLQNRAHREFWTDYFEASGAASTNIEPN